MPAVILTGCTQRARALPNLAQVLAMIPRTLVILALFASLGAAVAPQAGESLKSGPQVDENLPGAFQALNLNGAYAGQHHCLVCEFRLYPVAMVFVKAQPGGAVDPEVKKLLDMLDARAEDTNADFGTQAFVVFLTPDARSGATEPKVGNPENIIEETKNREKLIASLTEFAKPYKRLVITTYPAENIAGRYKLANQAEVTVLLYARHRVFYNYAFAEGKLNQAGVDSVSKGMDAMLERVKKGQAILKLDKK